MNIWPTFSTAPEHRTVRHNTRSLALLGLAAAGAALLSLCAGAVSLAPGQVLRALAGDGQNALAYTIVQHVRLPRTCACLLVGAALAAAGAILQSVMDNPLASPNIIGVNAGAGLLVVLCCIAAPLATAALPAAAFLGALGAVLLVLAIAEKAGAARITLVLAGVAIANLLSAGIDGLIALFPDAANGYADFRMGGFANVTFARVWPAAVPIAVCLAAALALGGELDILMLGTETAQSLGLPVRRVRLTLLTLAAALAGAAVSIGGLIGFLGLIAPHLTRRLVDGQSRVFLAACALCGAALLTLCDVAARTLFAPYELPVGILLSLLGGPFFLWLLLRGRGGRKHD